MSKVAVIIPCYNAENTLSDTLESILKQSYGDFFIVAINDGSLDFTANILCDYIKKHHHKLKVITQENQGQTAAKNQGISQSDSEYVAFCDSDDLWKTDKLAKQVALLNEQSEVGLCYTAADLIDEHSQKTDCVNINDSLKGCCYESLIGGNNIVASSVMVRRVALEGAGCFDESFRACENWDLWIRIARDWEVAAIDEPLTSYRVHQNNMTKDTGRMMDARLRVINKHLPIESLDSHVLKQRKESLYKMHLTFAKSYIVALQLVDARRQLVEALKLKPFEFNCIILYLKTLLGRNFFQWVRNRRSQAASK